MRIALLTATAIVSSVAVGARALELPDAPVLTPGGVMPNLIVTFDNSGLGALGSSRGHPSMGSGARRYDFSAAFNTYYYNPRRLYSPPPGFPNQNFTAARFFMNEGSVVNLETRYIATENYVPFSGSVENMWHPGCDSVYGSSSCTITKCGTTTYPCTFGAAFDPTHAYYYERDESLSGCTPGNLEDERCYKYVRVGSTEDQAICAAHFGAGADCSEAARKRNFANWYSYYRTGHLLFITTLLRTLPKLEGKARLAWQAHAMPNDGSSTNCAGFGSAIAGASVWHRTCSFDREGTRKSYDIRFKPYTGAHAEAFRDWLVNIPFAFYTPNTTRAAMIRAGEYFKHNDAYKRDDGGTGLLSCRQNFHLVFNGPFYSNRDVEGGYLENKTKTLCGSSWCPAPLINNYPKPRSALLPDPSGWFPRMPYCMHPGCGFSSSSTLGWNESSSSPSPSEPSPGFSLANLAHHFWVTDLRPDLANDVPPYLPDRSGDFEAQFWNPKNDPATWQHMVNFFVTQTALTNLDDGGAHGDGHDFAEGMYGGPIVDRQTKGWPAHLPGRPKGVSYDFWHGAINSRGLFIPAEDVDKIVEALSAAVDEVLKRGASASALASSLSSTETLTATHVYRAAYFSADWSGTLEAYRLDAEGRLAEEPEWRATIPAAGARQLYTWNGSAGQRFAYASFSDGQKTDFDAARGTLDRDDVVAWLKGDRSKEGTHLRKRERLLGDIANSDPVFVGDEFYPALSRLAGTEGSSYRAFVATKKDRPRMVYVGANDGMVHGFVAGDSAGGNRCDASELGQEVFAYIPGVLVGSLPLLAKKDYAHRFYADGPLFAGDAYLDLGDGTKWRTILVGGLGNGGRAVFALDVTDPCAFAANKVLWEFSSANDPDLGYTHARPLTAKLNNDQWAAIVANGYNSANGHAVLFLINLKTGALIKKIDADSGAGRLDNGLMSPTLYDADGNGTVDYVYAGDNLGRLWKFDLMDSNPDNWKVAFEGQPLFDTGGEPIVAAPRLADPPPGVEGVMVYFGSGRLVTVGDKTDNAGRGLYGVLDRGVGGRLKTHLVAQAVSTTEVELGGRRARKAATAHEVNYAEKYGWYLPLPDAGERVLSSPQLVQDRVFFVSMSPSDNPCGPGGTGWFYEIDRLNGREPDKSIMDFAAGGAFLSLKLKGPSKSAIVLRDYAARKGVILAHSLKGQTDSGSFSLAGLRLGRVSWREIVE